MIRLMIAALVLGASQASAETVISYDDGSTYTLEGEQEIFISTPGAPLFTQRAYANGNLYFIAQKPWPSRDYVATPADDLEPGSHEWCEAFVPWANGLTFDQGTWNRYCDTSGNGIYGPGDKPWKG